jgi:hypothetical protein
MRASPGSLQAVPGAFEKRPETTLSPAGLPGATAGPYRCGLLGTERPGRPDAGVIRGNEIASAASEGDGSCTLPRLRTAEPIAGLASRSGARRSQCCAAWQCPRIPAVGRRTSGEGIHNGAAPARARPRGAAGDAARAGAAPRAAHEPQGFLGPRGAAAARALLFRLRRRPAFLSRPALERALRWARVPGISRTSPAGRSPGRRAGPRRARDSR